MPRKTVGKNIATRLKRRRRVEDPMREFDRLPSELRSWLASADLPWRPRSVQRAYAKALARTGDKSTAIDALNQLQARKLASDACLVWGKDHPAAADHAG